jgi:2-keto-4-pentenoate hydratase/2-oxohepta-3-ene-1,7-dioic acid hydratase in catechol pathway
LLPAAEGKPPVRSPERFLKPGDVVEVSNPAMGTLRNRIVEKPRG